LATLENGAGAGFNAALILSVAWPSAPAARPAAPTALGQDVEITVKPASKKHGGASLVLG
jgi:hypothetical protein